jgi:hypothetical protein
MPIKPLTELFSRISENASSIRMGEHAFWKSQKYFGNEEL